MELKQIYLLNPNTENSHVTYENQLQPRVLMEDENCKRIYERHQSAILADVVREITDYVNDEDACNDEEDMFPRPSDMTGEWYIGEISFDDTYFSMETRFLGYHPNPPLIDDYLGLEVLFFYDKSQDKFVFNGINSACI